MDEPASAAALQLLRQLALDGVKEASAFLEAQQHASRHAGLLAGPFTHAGSRRLLSEGASSLSSSEKAVYIVICILLVFFAGCMAGLTLGLLSLDKVDLEVVKRSGTTKQRWLVSQVEPVLSHPHYLLATLLLCNAAAMEALPIFLDRLLNPLAAILISVTAILVFGEIVPQAVCKRYGLQVGAYLAWPVRFLMLITAPVTYPIAKLLDWILGEESALFRRQELKALVDIHAEPQGSEGDEGDEPVLTEDEVQVIQGALDMATKTAESAMTPIDKVSMLPADAVINLELLHKVINAGHSRLPVYEGHKQNIIGLILVKELVLVDENAGIKVSDLRLREVPFVRADTPMFDVLKIFRMGRSHMAFLTRVHSKLPEETSRKRTASSNGGFDGVEGQNKESSPKSLLARGSMAALRPFARLMGASSEKEEVLPTMAAPEATSGAAVDGPAAPAAAAMPRGSSNAGLAGLGRLLFAKPSPSQPAQPPEEVIGLITIEDVLEELLQAEILDETDQFVDNLQTIQATRLLTVQHLPPQLRRFLTRSIVASGTPNSARRSRGGGTATSIAAVPAGVAVFAPPAAVAASAASTEDAPNTEQRGVVPASCSTTPVPPKSRSTTPVPRAASAASISAAATATAIAAASVLGTSNLPALGTAVVAGTVAAEQLSAAQGQHPVAAGLPPIPPSSSVAGAASGMRRPPSAPPGPHRPQAQQQAPGQSRTVPARRAPANIPRRGSSSSNLAVSGVNETEMAGGSAAPARALSTEAVAASPGTSPTQRADLNRQN